MKAIYITPQPGALYRNRNGDAYRCETQQGVMRRVSDGWTLIAHGIQQYEDGTIEWDYSTGGHWPEEPERR